MSGLPPRPPLGMKFTRRENKRFKRAARLRKEGLEDLAVLADASAANKVISREERTTRRIKAHGIRSVRKGGGNFCSRGMSKAECVELTKKEKKRRAFWEDHGYWPEEEAAHLAAQRKQEDEEDLKSRQEYEELMKRAAASKAALKAVRKQMIFEKPPAPPKKPRVLPPLYPKTARRRTEGIAMGKTLRGGSRK